MLLFAPDRGMGQAVTDWWYSSNLQVVCFALLGLGALFYFTMRLTRQNLRSRPEAILAFVFLMLLGSWEGIPNSAAVPAWLPTISTVATVLMIIPVIAIGLNFYGTTRKVFPKPYFSEPTVGVEGREQESPTILHFLSFSLLAFLVFSALNANASLRNPPPPGLTFAANITDFTWFTPAIKFLNTYGFFAMAMFGAIYYIAPTLFPGEKLCPIKVRVHFFLAVVGVLLTFLPLAIGGLLQGVQFNNPSIPWMEIVKRSQMFLRLETVGAALLLAGHVTFVLNITAIAVRFYKARALRAFAEATAPFVPSTDPSR
jgi:cytochrome c oxidase cbb3-type subunit 1